MASGGEETNYSQCSVCLENGLGTIARHYCEECETYLCTECVKSHKIFKALKNHQINDVDFPDSVSVGDSTTMKAGSDDVSSCGQLRCTLHNDKPVDTYCVDHDCVCCGICSLFEHRSCATKSIVDASNDFKSSQEMNKSLDALKRILVFAEQEKQKRVDNLESIGTQKQELVEKVDSYEETTIVKIKELANVSREEIRSKCEEHKIPLGNDVTTMDAVMSTIRAYIDKLEQASDNAVLFALVKTIAKVIQDGDTLLQSMKQDWKQLELAYCLDKSLETTVSGKKSLGQFETIVSGNESVGQFETVVSEEESLGQIETIISEKESLGQFKTIVSGNESSGQIETIVSGKESLGQLETIVSGKESLGQLETIVSGKESLDQFEDMTDPEEYEATFQKNVNVEQNHEVKSPVSDLCVMESGNVIIADCYNRKIKRFSSDFIYRDELALNDAPAAVCKVGKHDVAVRTRNIGVHFVSVGGQMQLKSSFTLGDYGHGGMTYDDTSEEIFACEEKRVSVYSKTGNRLRTYDKDTNGEQIFTACRNIAMSDNKRDIYVSDTRKLIILDAKNGTLKMSVAVPGFSDTMPLCLLPGGVCLVGCQNKGVFVQIDKDGKQNGKIIDSKNGREYTWCAVYDRENSRLLVGGYPDVISVYTLSAKEKTSN